MNVLKKLFKKETKPSLDLSFLLTKEINSFTSFRTPMTAFKNGFLSREEPTPTELVPIDEVWIARYYSDRDYNCNELFFSATWRGYSELVSFLLSTRKIDKVWIEKSFLYFFTHEHEPDMTDCYLPYLTTEMFRKILHEPTFRIDILEKVATEFIKTGKDYPMSDTIVEMVRSGELGRAKLFLDMKIKIERGCTDYGVAHY